jgi:hypothetical protein
MDIYKYKIWTGHIPGISSVGCAKPSKPIINGGTTLPDDCTPCTTLTIREKIDACVDCDNGAVNVCCPNPGESCCGIIINPCDEFYSFDIETQVKYCGRCPRKHKSSQLKIIKNKSTLSKTSNSVKWCECCNRAGRDSQDSSLTIFLDHDFNDMGHYTMWDGNVGQEDTFANFLLTGDTTNPSLISLNNSTEFGFYNYLKGIEYTVDWGDGTALDVLNAPSITATHPYMGTGTYIVTVQMRAPWGVSSVKHEVTIPFLTGDQIWFTVPNPSQTYTFTPPSGGAPISMDYEGSEFGPLDGGLGVNSYVTANYVPTPYAINGITDSMLSSLKSYSNSSSPGLPPGYTIGNTVNIGGQVQLPNGTYVENLWGTVDNFDNSIPGEGYTGYTITNGTDVYTLVDHENGVTVFSTNAEGLTEEDFLTRECGMALQGSCDLCNGTQYYYLGGYATQNVHTDRGEWDDNESYDPGDYVSYDGCCFFAISILDDTIPEPDRYDLNSVHWRLCFGSCTEAEVLPSRYNCIQGLCIEILPTSAYYDTATYVGTPPTTANALADCALGCVPPVGVEIQWMCEIQGICSPIPPSHGYYNLTNGPNGETIYSGPTAYVDCTTNCVNTTIGYDCDNGVCVPVVGGGFYGDITACQATCGSTYQLWDWWCVNLPAGQGPPVDDPDPQCTAIAVAVQGTSTAPTFANHTAPYANINDCLQGCGNVITWQCVCDMYAPNTIVDLSSSLGFNQFGGQRCMAVLNSSDPNAYTDKTDCEESCWSYECDESDGTFIQVDATTGPPNSNFCSEFDISNGGVQTDPGSGTITNINVSGITTNCFVPDVYVCIAGDPTNSTGCKKVTINDTTPGTINPGNQLTFGTQLYVGTDITWANAFDWTCGDESEAACYAPLSNNNQTSGCGCTDCASLAALGNLSYPVELYDPNDLYVWFDVIITNPSPVSQNSQQYKYWYDPRPVCDNTNTAADDGAGGTVDCTNSTVFANCEDPVTNSIGGQFPLNNLPAPNQGTHPCTILNCLDPQYNVSPPTAPTVSRQNSETCWRPCGTP